MATEFELLKVRMEAQFQQFDQALQNTARATDRAMSTIEQRTSRAASRAEYSFRQMALSASSLSNFSSGFSGLAAIAGGPLSLALASASAGMVLWTEHTESGRNAVERLKTSWNDLIAALAHDIGGQSGSNDVLNRDTAKPGTFNESALRRSMPLDKYAMQAGAARSAEYNAALSQFMKDAQAVIDQSDQAGAEKRQQVIDQEVAATKDALKTLDATDAEFSAQRAARAHETAQEEIRALQDVVKANEKFDATIQKQRDDALVARVDADAASLEEFARADEQSARMWEHFKRNSEDALTDAIEGTRSFGDAFKAVIADLEHELINRAISKPLIAALFGKGDGVGGGLIGAVSSILGFAGGGDPPVGRASLVGENGPELFIPRTAGTIYPNGGGPGGGAIMVHVTVTEGPLFGAKVTAIADSRAGQALASYDRTALPGRVAQISSDPFKR